MEKKTYVLFYEGYINVLLYYFFNFIISKLSSNRYLIKITLIVQDLTYFFKKENSMIDNNKDHDKHTSKQGFASMPKDQVKCIAKKGGETTSSDHSSKNHNNK